MGVGARSGVTQVRPVVSELLSVHLAKSISVAPHLPNIRTSLGVEAVFCVSRAERIGAWALERFESDGLPSPTRLRRLIQSVGVGRTFDVRPRQRNMVLDVRRLFPRGDFERSDLYRHVLEPLRLHRHHILVAALCDGASTHAWFGVLDQSPIAPRVRAHLSAILPAVRRRLLAEDRIQYAPVVSAALRAALERAEGPALVVNASGRVYECNQAARMLIATGTDLASAVRTAIAGRGSIHRFELTPLVERGNEHWLAVLRAPTREARVSHAISRTSARLRLTARQRDVLTRLVGGDSNAAIASALRVSERAVEQHVTAIFDRASVANRAGLVAMVLLGD